MVRPCLLIIDREHSATISTRKLVIESAKFNVITAYSGSEALETIERFPAVDGLILNAVTTDIPCTEVVATVRRRAPKKLPVIVVQGPGGPECTDADHYIDSFDPVQLLELLRNLFPRASNIIKRQDDALKAEENQVEPRR